MVAVPSDHILQHRNLVRVDSEQAVFLEYEHPHFVTQVQELGCHRVVAGSVGIGPHPLKALYAVALESVRNGRADSGVVLVVVGALELDVLSVEKEAPVLVQYYLPEAGASGEFIHCLSVEQHSCDHFVEIGIVKIPKGRTEDFADCRAAVFLPCKQGFPLSSGPGHNVSCGIQDAVLHAVSREPVVEVVAYFGFYSHPGLRVVLGQGAVHESASCRDVQGIGFLQPHMAVDSGAFVEPAFLKRSVAAHADEIGLLRLVAEQKIVGDVVVLVYVSAGLHTHEKAVHPDLRVAEYAVKL